MEWNIFQNILFKFLRKVYLYHVLIFICYMNMLYEGLYVLIFISSQSLKELYQALKGKYDISMTHCLNQDYLENFFSEQNKRWPS